jgi:hypothetical protein
VHAFSISGRGPCYRQTPEQGWRRDTSQATDDNCQWERHMPASCKQHLKDWEWTSWTSCSCRAAGQGWQGGFVYNLEKVFHIYIRLYETSYMGHHAVVKHLPEEALLLKTTPERQGPSSQTTPNRSSSLHAAYQNLHLTVVNHLIEVGSERFSQKTCTCRLHMEHSLKSMLHMVSCLNTTSC